MKGIRKVYDREVLRVDNLALRKGQIYGVIGPSGAGKSTFLRIINLLTSPDSGSILIHGKEVPRNGAERLALQRRMSMVFQKTLLFRDTVWNNVAYGLRARGFDRTEIGRRVRELLEQVGMTDLSLQRADTLSGGEAQRVAIARAVAFEPELLLLDEPTANLDPCNIEMIENMVVKLNSSKSITVVVVTHNIFQAHRIAREVIFINQGNIVEMGETEQIFSAPREELTRAYVEGRMIY